MLKQQNEDKFLIVKIALGLVVFTAALVFAIMQFTGTGNSSISTGGAFTSSEAFKQNAEAEQKPKLRSASTAVNRVDSIDMFEKTNESYFAEQRKAAEEAEAAKKAKFTSNKTRKTKTKTNSSQTTTVKTVKSTKKTKQETVIPRMKHSGSGYGAPSGANFGGQSAQSLSMPDMSSLTGGNGQISQDQINKLIQNAQKQTGR